MIGTINLIIGIITVLMLGFFLWDRYRPRPHRLDINTKQTLFARFGNSSNKAGNWGIVFYSMKIVNVSRFPITVRDLQLRYKMDGKILSDISQAILTGTSYSPYDKKDIDSAIVQTGGNNIILQGWYNLRTVIGLYKSIEPGGVLSGSAYFILNTNDHAKLAQLNEFEFVVTDFLGRESTQKIKIEKDWLLKANDAVILNKHFSNDKNGTITYA
ncbi:hypothetical protein ACFLVO_02230 [Chloroflexota bacterium]